MQMESVETNAGAATCCADRESPRQRLLLAHVAVRVLDLDRRVVHEDADRQRQSAQRHHVDRLAQRHKITSEVAIDSGIDMQTISVERQIPETAESSTQ